MAHPERPLPKHERHIQYPLPAVSFRGGGASLRPLRFDEAQGSAERRRRCREDDPRRALRRRTPCRLRRPNAIYLVEPADRFAKLVYLPASPFAEHLAERVADWPGACSLGLHLSGRSKTVKRPRGFFRPDGKMPDEVTIRLERPDGFEDLSDAEWSAKVQDAVLREEARAREERVAAGRRVLGRKAILRAEPTDTPKTVEPRRGLRPHLACLGKARRLRELDALIAFRAERRAAVLRAMRGERDVVFPYGTYRVRAFVFLCAPPPVAAVA